MVKSTENLDAATFKEITLNTLTKNNNDSLLCLVLVVAARIEIKLGYMNFFVMAK